MVAVLGPTATGKSALALAIAGRFGGEIVNCDSTAVFRGFDIGTDKVPVDAQRGIPHHLIDIADPIEEYTAAQYARERTGRGQWVHTSLLEAMVNFMDFQACRWLTDGEVPPQQGNDHPTFFPMGTYRCADGYVNIAGLKGLDAFLGALSLDDLLDDPRFATDDARKANRVAFNAACEERLASMTVVECVEQLNALDIPAGPVYSVDQVFADPQVEQLDLYERRDDAAGNSVALLR